MVSVQPKVIAMGKYGGSIMDQKALVFSTDLLLSLVIFSIILGLSADMIDNYSIQMQEHLSRNSHERLAREATDILIKTAGSPDNWEELSTHEVKIPGLSKKDSNLISYKKVLQLKKDYHNLMPDNVFPSFIHTSIIIYPLNPVLEPVIIHNSSKIASCSDIVVVNRTINCDFRNDESILLLEINPDDYNSENKEDRHCFSKKCPHLNINGDHLISDPEAEYYWICAYFQINKSQVDYNDYYIITDDPHLPKNTGWIIDQAHNPSVVKKEFNGSLINVNSAIKTGFNGNDFEIFWLHIYFDKASSKKFKVYLVEVAPTTPQSELKAEYFQIQPCHFILKTGVLS